MDKNESNSFFKNVNIDKNISFNNKNPFVLIAGPCVLESKEHAFSMVDSLKNITQKLMQSIKRLVILKSILIVSMILIVMLTQLLLRKMKIW